MRITWTALTGFAALALLSMGAPPATANPTTTAEAKIVKAAEAAGKAIVKAAAKEIALHGKFTASQVGALTRAAKTGVNIESLSGVASTEGVKVSVEQLAGLEDAAIRFDALFHSATYETCDDAYDAFAASVPINVLGDSEATRRLPGTGGPCDTFVTGLSDACDRGAATLGGACRAFQTAALAKGFSCTRIAGPTPPFVPPTFHVSPEAPFPVSVIHSTWGDSFGRFNAVVSNPGVTSVGDFTEANTMVVMSGFSGTVEMGGSFSLPFINVERHEEPQEPVASSQFSVFVLSGTVVDSPVALTLPLRIVGPGPCEPPPGKSVITPSPTALHLGPVVKNQEAISKAVSLRNSGTSYLQVIAQIQGTDVSKFFLYNTGTYIQGGDEGLIEVGGSSTTAGTFHAKIHLTWPGGSLDVPIDLVVTN